MTERSCVHHESNPAIAICSACEGDICASCHRTTIAGFALCAACEREVRAELLPAWEVARTVPEYGAAYATCAANVMFSTRHFFGKMPPYGSWVKPAIFGVISQAIGMMAQFAYSWMFIPDFAERIAEQSGSGPLTGGEATALLLLAMPFVAPIVLLIHAGLLWLSLRIFGASARFATIMRISGYASAAHLFQLIPPIGEFPLGYMLAIVWLVNLELLGVRRFFPELSPFKAMGAVFLPFFALTLMGLA